MRLPPGPKRGTHKGFGFVTFTTKVSNPRMFSTSTHTLQEEAEASIALNGIALKSRNLDVTIAQANPGKQKPGNAIDSSCASTPGSDDHPTNGAAMDTTSPTSPRGASPALTPSFDAIKKKTLGVMNIADTVNDTKIRELFAPYGPLRKVTLRPDHQGAIVEYETVADAGKATLALDGREVAGSKIRIGSLPDLMRMKPVTKVMKGFAPKKEEKSALFAAPTSVLRSGAGATRGQKRRTGLGFTGSIGRPKAGEAKKEDTVMADGNEEGGKAKSNADFKAMFLRK